MEITPIAKIHTLYPTKFGIPRQSGLVESTARIVFENEYRNDDALRGIEDFSHLWLIWEFSEAKQEKFSPTVRPPRLGGNTRMGVFATRSPFRPNSLGLSCVKLIKKEKTEKEGTVLYVSGADILDGTPIYDIKPYLPFADSVPEAKGGFAQSVEGNSLKVQFLCDISFLSEEDLSALTQILENDPRPHYHTDEEKIYSFEYSIYNIKFTCDNKFIYVREVQAININASR